MSKYYCDGSKNNGEGEHKIFDYIRNNKDHHIHKNTLVYGLDADLIMLFKSPHISDKINLFGEKPDYSTDLDDIMMIMIFVLISRSYQKSLYMRLIEDNVSNKQLCNDKTRLYFDFIYAW